MSNSVTEAELWILISLAKKALWAPVEIRKIIQDHKVNIIPANFYSTVPSVIDVENSFEYRDDKEEIYIVVHTHDVNLPYGFPKHRVIDKHLYWTKQYLLYAYMLDNPKIEVLFGSAYIAKKFPNLTERLMGGKFQGGGGSIWYRLNGGRDAL